IRMAPFGQRHVRRTASLQPLRRARVRSVLPSMRLNGETPRRRRERLIRRGWNRVEKAAPPFSGSVDHNNKSKFRAGDSRPVQLRVIRSRGDREESRASRDPSTRLRGLRDDANASLDRDLGAGLFEDLLDLLGLFLGDPFLDGLRSPLNEVLRFLQAEA